MNEAPSAPSFVGVRTLSIGEVARRSGLATSAIRYYERSGVLPQPDRSGTKRVYDETVLDRLATIGVAKQAGFTLDEVRELLAAIDRGDPAHDQLRGLARRKLPEVEALIARAEAVRRWLLTAGDCGCTTLDECGLFQDADSVPQATVTVVVRPARAAS
jgi:MerR family redox-sensitive transcriptional activator SoxR